MNMQKISIIALLMTLTGCASTVVKNDDIANKTAFTLGLEKSAFTISNRVDNGIQTTYIATTKTGKKYNCYVEGAFSFGTGGVVSDAICKEIGKTETKTGGSDDASCNALLRAAGRC